MIRKLLWSTIGSLLLASPVFAAFVESGVGNAVTNDATAAFFNPASLSLLPNPQFVWFDGYASVRSQFVGTTQQNLTGFLQTGGANSRTRYVLPGVFFGVPINKQLTFAFGGLYNFYGIGQYRSDSILRYFETYNAVYTYDIVMALSYRLNQYVSFGVGSDLGIGSITLDSAVGFPTFGIPDAITHNHGDATSWGGHAGILITPRLGTLIGFTYHSPISYTFRGFSSFQSTPTFDTNNFSVHTMTPSSYVLTVDQFVNPKLGFLATIQRTNWSVIRNLNLNNVALKFGPIPFVVSNSITPYYLRNVWRIVLGTHYQVTPKWAVRAQGAWDQEPENPKANLSPGNNIWLGISGGYQFSKRFTLDGYYAHIFYKKMYNNFNSGGSQITGYLRGGRDYIGFSAKINFV